jgi:hypothetical protein
MVRMARERGGRRAGGTRVPCAAVLLALAALLTGCSGDDEEPPEPIPSSAQMALSLETVRGAGTLSEKAQADAETEVGDVLSHYVVEGFLGDFPRDDFVGAFDSFTGGAARTAAGNIDLLTANPYRDAVSVHPTRLDARLSFLVDGPDVVGASAAVDLGFEAELPDGETAPFTVRGRLLLERAQGTWSVFGYDITRDDPDEIDVEASP